MPGNSHENLNQSAIEVAESSKPDGIEQPQINSQLEKALNEKVYGRYPGKLPKDFVDRCNENENGIYFELAVYCHYKEAEKIFNDNFTTLWNTGIDFLGAEKREREYAKQFSMAQTKKFGVEIETDKDGRIERNDSFLRWQKYWDDFYKKLSGDERKAAAFVNAYKNNKNLIPFLPKTRWNGEGRGEEK